MINPKHILGGRPGKTTMRFLIGLVAGIFLGLVLSSLIHELGEHAECEVHASP